MRLGGAGCAKREETKLENYVKAVLYVYPRLERLEKDCEEHIRNRAYMSYDYRTTAERLSEELAEEIIRKGLIGELKRKTDAAIGALKKEEKFLLELRYFRRKSRLKQFCGETDFKEIGSERNYYRRHAKLLKKVSGALQAQGLTKETFFSDYARFDWLMSVYRFIEAGKEGRNAAKEHSLVEFLYGKSAGPTFRELWKKGKKRDG